MEITNTAADLDNYKKRAAREKPRLTERERLHVDISLADVEIDLAHRGHGAILNPEAADREHHASFPR